MLDARDLEGDISIYNRYGRTRFYQTNRNQGGRCNLRTVSGEINLVLDERTAKTTSLVMHTRCGVLKYGEVKELMPLKVCSSNGYRM